MYNLLIFHSKQTFDLLMDPDWLYSLTPAPAFHSKHLASVITSLMWLHTIVVVATAENYPL